jgi:tetratricopeptide (TPR) repeat protein
MENGTPPPAGAMIELNCNGTVTREAAVQLNGSFSFQLGASSLGELAPDLSQGITDPLMRDSERSVYDPSTQTSRSVMLQRLPSGSSRLTGCSLRAALSGYKSSVLELGSGTHSLINEVGTITLFPINRVRGSTLSSTSLLAPKSAKKDLETAAKAMQKKNAAEAERSLKSAVATYSKYAEAWFQLGNLYQIQQRDKEAENAFSKAIECDKLFVNPYVALAWIMAREKKWQETADLAEESLALDPTTYPEAYYLSAMANYNLNDWVLAQERARQLLRMNAAPRFPKIYLILASILDGMNNTTGSAEALRNYLQYAPNAPDADLVRAQLQEKDKQFPEHAK